MKTLCVKIMVNPHMADSALSIIDIKHITDEISLAKNIPLTQLNDHVVRVSVMTEPYFWHYHPNSDETFMVLEGSVFIDLEDKTIELFPNQLFTIPKNVKHRTRPSGSRSVNLTFESTDLVTTKIDAPA
jgi:mannose-6-phosphate isomerase-like protein (cupin superfamily)